MELREYLRTAWKWRWLIVLCTLCAGLASFVLSSQMPPVYEASVLLMSNQWANSLVDYSSVVGGEQMVETYQELLKTGPVLESAIARLDLPYSVRELRRRVKVRVVPQTELLELTVEDNDAQRAADVANEIALAFLLQRSNEHQLQELENRRQRLVEQIGDLEEAIDRGAAELEQLRASPGLLTQEELATLQGQQTEQRSTYAQLLSGYVTLRDMESRLLELVIVESAQPASEPVRPRKLLNTAVATTGGCALACALAFLLEYLNDAVEDVEEMRDLLSLPSLGTIPYFKGWQQDGPVRVTGEEWSALEGFHMLRTNIQFADVDDSVHTLLVTSPGPGDGKTSVVANLGVAMARDGRRVVLVDADLRRPRLHSAFEVPNLVGLTSLTLVPQERCIVETDTPNLYVLPSGPLPPSPSALLGSQRMAELIEELESFADIVLFDAPPVLAFADAMVLASQTDGVLLVVDSRSTRRDAAKRAVEMLRNVDTQVLGGVLNKTRDRSSGYYRYYHSDGRGRRKAFANRLRNVAEDVADRVRPNRVRQAAAGVGKRLRGAETKDLGEVVER